MLKVSFCIIAALEARWRLPQVDASELRVLPIPNDEALRPSAVTTCALALVLFVNSYQKNASRPNMRTTHALTKTFKPVNKFGTRFHKKHQSDFSTMPNRWRWYHPGRGEPEYGCCKEMNGGGRRDAMGAINWAIQRTAGEEIA